MATCDEEAPKQPQKYITETSKDSELDISHSITFLYDNIDRDYCNPDRHQRLFKVRHRFFRLEGLLGSGKYGKVYACLEIDPSSVKSNGENGDKAVSPIRRVAIKRSYHYECFKTEYNVLIRSGTHPFVIAIYDGISLHNNQLLLMEYVSGIDLFTLAFRVLERNMTAAESWFYLTECAEAISHLHTRGIVHQDIKSDNILIDGRGHVKVADFGLALYKLPLGQKKRGQLISHSRHMPPEIVLSDPHSKNPSENLEVWHAVDWFSLGVMAYRLLYQAYPYEGKTKSDLETSYKRTVIQFKTTEGRKPPMEMQNLIRELLNPDPEKRLGGNVVNGFEDVMWHPAIRDHPRLSGAKTVNELRLRIRNGALNSPFKFAVEEDDMKTKETVPTAETEKEYSEKENKSFKEKSSKADIGGNLPIILEA